MAGIDMINDFSMPQREESTIQSGGAGGGIEMFGGDGVTLKHNPIGTEQIGGKSAGLDMVGPTDILNHTASPLYGQKEPTDKGKI